MRILWLAGLLLAAAPVTPAPAPKGDVKFELASAEVPLLVVPVKVNGQGPYRFVLDTGASGTVVTPELAKKLGLVTTADAKGIGAGGEVEMKISSVKKLSVGAAELPDLEVAVGTVADIGVPNLDGILGYNFLKAFKVTIDYPRSTLGLDRPAK